MLGLVRRGRFRRSFRHPHVTPASMRETRMSTRVFLTVNTK